MLSYLNKTSTLMTSSNGSRIFERESDPPALSAYLQERAAVRAASKTTTPFNVPVNSRSSSPKLSISTSAHEIINSVATTTNSQVATAVPSALKQTGLQVQLPDILSCHRIFILQLQTRWQRELLL